MFTFPLLCWSSFIVLHLFNQPLLQKLENTDQFRNSGDASAISVVKTQTSSI
jgi:hypothetical protein